VFPFDSDLSTEELRLHVEYALEGIKPFEIELRGITGDFHDGYLFLNVKKGNDSVIELHDALYSGVLRRFLFRQVTYCPHLTVGRVEPALDFGKALNELDHVDAQFRTVIDRVYVEDIDSTEHSAIECSVGLK
jgi:2'-5' RNA ligase